MANFLMLLILHFIGDFYLQTSRIAKCKNANTDENCCSCENCKDKKLFNNKFVVIHTFLYAIPFLLVFLMIRWTYAIIILVTVLCSHYFIDLLSCCLYKKTKQTIVFVIDQFLHTVVLFAAYKLFEMNSCLLEYELFVKIAFAVLFLIVPSSVFINKLFQDLFSDSEKDKIFDVGSIIGMLERALTLIFACFSDFAAIAIIITVKTWARSGDLREDKKDFRNKYLLGTLASLVLAVMTFLVFKI